MGLTGHDGTELPDYSHGFKRINRLGEFTVHVRPSRQPVGFAESVRAMNRKVGHCAAESARAWLQSTPLALAEAQRYMPTLVTKVETLLEKYELSNENIIMRMTGCPNGCARSYLAEIGFVGTAPGKYNLHLGGDHQGQRLNKIYKESLDEAGILGHLEGVFSLFKKERKEAESFGDYAVRKQLVS